MNNNRSNCRKIWFSISLEVELCQLWSHHHEQTDSEWLYIVDYIPTVTWYAIHYIVAWKFACKLHIAIDINFTFMHSLTGSVRWRSESCDGYNGCCKQEEDQNWSVTRHTHSTYIILFISTFYARHPHTNSQTQIELHCTLYGKITIEIIRNKLRCISSYMENTDRDMFAVGLQFYTQE